jgi:hypothetical protein
LRVTYGFWIGWLDLLTPYTLHLELQAITVLSLFPHFAVHCCKHTRVLRLHSPLVVSWQWIYNSLTVTAAHMKSSLHCLIPFLPLFCQLTTSRDSLNSIPLLPSSYPGRLVSWNSTDPNHSCVRSSLYSLGVDPQKTPLPLLLRVDSLLQSCVYCTVA